MHRKLSNRAHAFPTTNVRMPIRIAVLAIVIFMVMSQHVGAGTEKSEPAMLSTAKFATGVLTAYALHEVGHLAGARLTNTDIEFGVGRYNQPIGFTENANDDLSGLIVHGSGLVTQALVSEVILRSDSIDKNDTFVRGMMFWNVVNPIVYALDYWIIRRTNQESENSYQGDIEGVENYSDEGTANAFAAVMAMVAGLQGYRYAKTQTWAPDWIKNERIDLTCHPVRSHGAVLAFHYQF